MVNVVTKQEASENTKSWCGISDRQERLIKLNESADTGHHDVETTELTSGRFCRTKAWEVAEPLVKQLDRVRLTG